MFRSVTHMFFLLSVFETFSASVAYCCSTVVFRILGAIHDFYVSERTEDLNFVHHVGSNGPWSSYPPRHRTLHKVAI